MHISEGFTEAIGQWTLVVVFLQPEASPLLVIKVQSNRELGSTLQTLQLFPSSINPLRFCYAYLTFKMFFIIDMKTKIHILEEKNDNGT